MKENRTKKLDEPTENRLKKGIGNIEVDSTPAPGTQKGAFFDQINALFTDFNKLCQKTVPRYPYKLAKLVHHNYDVTKRWYVDFSAWNVKTERLERRRLFNPLNRKKNTLAQRLDIGREMVSIVNAQLTAGMCLGRDEITAEPPANIKTMRVSEALLFFKDHKEAGGYRKSYYRSYVTLATNWLEYVDARKQTDFELRQLDANDLHHWFTWLKKEKQIANKTHNKYRSDFNIFIRWVMKRYPGTFKKNPVEDVPILKTVARKHAAFSDEQMKAILALCLEKEYTQLWLFIHFIYYTLARPNELMQLRIHHIDVKENRLFIPGTISKNRNDEWVAIAPPLLRAIKRAGILKADPQYYIFGKKQAPGEAMPYRSTFWERNVKVLKELNYTDRPYDIYSYKHSGAISLYRATKDIKLVQRQCRHQSIELSGFNRLGKFFKLCQTNVSR